MQVPIFGDPKWIEQTKTKTKPDPNVNPCLTLFGPGETGKTCFNCAQLIGICKAKTYYKCRLRSNTHGPATDHKRKWPACAKFEQREGTIPLYDGRG